MPSDPEPSPGFAHIGPITILGELGAGAGSRVFRIRREEDGRDYALKVVTANRLAERKYLTQAANEFRIGRMLDHPNLVAVHCLETDGGWLRPSRQARILLELALGVPAERAALSTGRLSRVFMWVAEALAHMHARGVIHADVKPGNVIVGVGDQVKLIDFGLAWIRDEPRNRVQGTPGYMAPETGTTGEVSERTDVYSFGATLYRLAVGRPLPDSSPGLSFPQLIHRRHTPIELHTTPEVPTELMALIGECVRFDPAERPANMIHVRDRLWAIARAPGEAQAPIKMSPRTEV